MAIILKWVDIHCLGDLPHQGVNPWLLLHPCTAADSLPLLRSSESPANFSHLTDRDSKSSGVEAVPVPSLRVIPGPSLVVQWLRICLSMQVAWDQSLVGE